MRRDVLHRVTEITKGTRYSLHYRLQEEKTYIMVSRKRYILKQ